MIDIYVFIYTCFWTTFLTATVFCGLLYQNEGIPIDENWITDLQDTHNEIYNSKTISDDTESCTNTVEYCAEDEWTESQTKLPACVTDTMLTPLNYWG